MFSTFGVFAIAFLESRFGLVGTVITETIVGIGASPRVAGAPLIRILGIVMREWHHRRHIEPSAIASGWVGWACAVLLAVASLLGTISSDSVVTARACGRRLGTLLARVRSESFIIGRELSRGIEAGLMTLGRLMFSGSAGIRECLAMVRCPECVVAV